MTLLKSYTYTWWQIGVFKLALLSIGAIIGAYWADFWLANIWVLAVIAVVASVYVMYVSLKQK